MGAIAVWLLEHSKVIVAWTALLAAVVACAHLVYNSPAYSYISSGINDAVVILGNVASWVPNTVSDVNTALVESIRESNGFGQLIFWLGGFDVCVAMADFVIAQISAAFTVFNMLVGSALLLVGGLWTLRQVQRWTVAISGGRLSGAKMVD